MRAIAPSAVLFLGCLAVALPGASPTAIDTLGGMVAALSDDNPAGFMKPIDPGLPEYGKLKSEVSALLDQSAVASSIEVLKDQGDEAQRSVDLDWFLEIHPSGDIGPLVHRREVVHCKLQRDKKGWRVISISPIEFFAPLTLDKNTAK